MTAATCNGCFLCIGISFLAFAWRRKGRGAQLVDWLWHMAETEEISSARAGIALKRWSFRFFGVSPVAKWQILPHSLAPPIYTVRFHFMR